MESEEDPRPASSNARRYYKPVQRIDQACQSCRKRKARCSGERPKCDNCQKFSRECSYQIASRKSRGSPNPQKNIAATSSSVQELSDRLENIERLLHHQIDLVSRLLSSPQNVPYITQISSQIPQLTARNPNPSQTPSSFGSVGEEPPPDLCPSTVILETVDLFFLHCHNQPYCFFHEPSFRKRLSRGEIPNYLLYAVLATAIRFSANPYFRDKETAAERYANYSWNSIMSNCFAVDRVGDIQIVQTVTLLGVFDFTAGKRRHASAWVKIGLSVRIAQDLKLMMESGGHLSNEEQEERRRVFWSIYLLDRMVSCGRGRPPAILDASCQLHLPCDEITWRNGACRRSKFTLGDISRRVPLHTLYQHSSPTANVIAVAYTVSRAAQYTLQGFKDRNSNTNLDLPPWDPNSDFSSILSDLHYLETLLEIPKPSMEILYQWTSPSGNGGERVIDQQCLGPVIFARALYHLCYCLLHHPFLLRQRLLGHSSSFRQPTVSGFLSTASTTAWEHAKATIELLQDMRSAGAIAHTSSYGYCVVVAGSIAALQLNHASGSRRAEATVVLQASLDFLQDISRYWNNVSYMTTALKRFSDDSHNFAELISDALIIKPFSQEECETLLTLVDYSTISNAPSASRVKDSAQYGPDLLSDVHNSWFDLFEGVVDADLTVSDMELPVNFGVADYASAM